MDDYDHVIDHIRLDFRNTVKFSRYALQLHEVIEKRRKQKFRVSNEKAPKTTIRTCFRKPHTLETQFYTKFFLIQLQSWIKLVKKFANFAHISQSNLRNTPPEEK